MRRSLAALALAAGFFALPCVAAGPAQDSSPYGLCPPERFEITAFAVPSGDERTFRFDRVCGAIEVLGADHLGRAEWQALEVSGLPGCIVDGRVHYRLFMTPQKDHVFILNTDVKTTWELDPAKMTWRQM